MQIINMLFYTAITLGVLVFIHELGHFLAAKLTGMRVDRFSIGFPPRAFGKKIGETDYCVSWIPIGGYVKIAGMVDESMDTEFLNRTPEPWEFRSRPMWARMLVISAGVIMNVLLAVGIFTAIHLSKGKMIEETTEIGAVMQGTPAEQAGFRQGDVIRSINGQTVTHWDEIQNLIYIEHLGDNITFAIHRASGDTTLFVPARSVKQTTENPFGIIAAHTATMIEAVESNMPAAKIGIQPGDEIVSVNGKPVSYLEVVSTIKQNAGKEITIDWKHAGEAHTGQTTVTKEGRIGVRIGALYNGPIRHLEYTFTEAVGAGFDDVGQSVHLFILTFSKIFAGKASVRESLGGPIAIAQMATQSAESGFLVFIWFMAQLSMSLALLNILPFPALDGGHLVMLIYEKIFRREIPHKVKIAIQQAGFIILLAFMAFIIYNDISRF